ncbi:hypothetical protein ACFL06_00550 [Patescibacteria group bacterium]
MALLDAKMAPIWAMLLALILTLMVGYVWIGMRDDDMGASIYLILMHVPIAILVAIATIETWYKMLTGGPPGGWFDSIFKKE